MDEPEAQSTPADGEGNESADRETDASASATQSEPAGPGTDEFVGTAEPGTDERAAAMWRETQPITAIVSAATAPRLSPRRRGRMALWALSALLLVASLMASLFISGGSVEGLMAYFAPPSPTARATFTPLPTATATLAPTATTKPTATPGLVGDGIPRGGGAFPPYTGPISAGQGCPSGQAPNPVGWAIRGASDYGAPPANAVALTFDDGPTPYYSPAIISYLEQTHTPATFFVLGQYAQAYPWLIQREAADGFTIGIHTWSHPDMLLLTPDQRAWQLAATAQQLHTDLGPNFCLWLWRPPYGDYNSAIVAQAGSFGLTTIMWNDDPADWSQPGTMTIVNRVLTYVHPGSIILLHDGPAGRSQTLAALPYILDGLRQRGLTPVSLPQLLLGYPAPTATPTASPSPTATDTPTATATATVTPTSTVSPSPTASLIGGGVSDAFAIGRWFVDVVRRLGG